MNDSARSAATKVVLWDENGDGSRGVGDGGFKKKYIHFFKESKA